MRAKGSRWLCWCEMSEIIVGGGGCVFSGRVELNVFYGMVVRLIVFRGEGF